MTESGSIDRALLSGQTEWLRALALRLVADADAAEDVVQDTLVSALRRPPQDRGDGLRGWLAAVARNHARRRARSASVRRFHEQQAAAGRPEQSGAPGPAEEELERLRIQQRLTDAVLALREPYRSAVVLRFREGLGHRALGQALGVEPATARKRVSRGVELLRKELGSEQFEGRDWRLALVGFAAPPRGLVEAAGFGGIAMGTVKMATATAAAGVALWVVWGLVAGGGDAGRPAGDGGEGAAVAGLRDLAAPPSAAVEPDRQRAAIAAPTAPAQAPEATAPIPAERLLRGRVSSGGQPVAGAQVEVLRDELRGFSSLDLGHDNGGRPVGDTRTDAAGEFSIEVAAGLPYDLRASSEGLAATRSPNHYAGEFVELELTPGAGLRGRVVRPDGSTVADALIEGTWDDGERPSAFEVRTDASGDFDVRGLEPGRVRISVSPVADAALLRRTVTLIAGQSIDVELVVEPGRSVAGRVLDADTGLPIAGAEVGDSWVFDRPTRTDRDGRFRIDGFRNTASFELHARAPGYGRGEASAPNDPAGVDDLIITLRPAVAARGRLVDGDGSPITTAYVSVLSGVDWKSTQPGEDGSFDFAGLRAGAPYSLFVVAEGHGTTAVEFPRPPLGAGAYDLGDIALAPGSLLGATVVDSDGRPVASTDVVLIAEYDGRDRLSGSVGRYTGDIYIDQRNGSTDGEGRVAFGDLGPGTYYLAAGRYGQTVGRSDPIRVEAGRDVTGARIILDAAYTFDGRVADEAGNPVAGAVVTIFPEVPTESRMAQVFTDPDGRFRVTGFAAGSYRFLVGPTELESTEPRATPLRSIQLGGLSPFDSPLELVLPAATRLDGTVIDSDEGGVEDAPVALFSDAGESLESTRTGEGGSFSFDVDLDRAVLLYAGPVGSAAPVTIDEARSVDGGVLIGPVEAGTDRLTLRLP